MFTGIIKLAQIDDYINPSQNCIQPKIIKQGDKVEKATVSLNDCLACSGCITSAESVLIEQMGVQKLKKQLQSGEERDIAVLLAPQVVLSLARSYQQKPQSIFWALNQFFKDHFKVKLVLDLWEGIMLAHELIYREYLAKLEPTLLCSQCPGWICYAQKTLNENVIKLMSRIKSPQQIMARILKEQKKEVFIVSVMPCYDKKLQAIRFNIEEGVKQVDITITTTQLVDLYKDIMGNDAIFDAANYQVDVKIDRMLPVNINVPYGFIQDQTSNGYIEALVSKLGGSQVKKTEIKNSDFIEYEFIVNGKTVKMAKCYGFRNIQKIVQTIKKKKCEYSYVEIMACPGGCFSGGGQIKVEKFKPKQVAASFVQMSKQLVLKQQIQGIDGYILASNADFTADYKMVEKTLTQSVMSW